MGAAMEAAIERALLCGFPIIVDGDEKEETFVPTNNRMVATAANCCIIDTMVALIVMKYVLSYPSVYCTPLECLRIGSRTTVVAVVERN
jgi:hypothetical protein